MMGELIAMMYCSHVMFELSVVRMLSEYRNASSLISLIYHCL